MAEPSEAAELIYTLAVDENPWNGVLVVVTHYPDPSTNRSYTDPGTRNISRA